MLDGGKGTKYSNASQLIPTVQRSATSPCVSLPRPNLSMPFPVEHSMSDYTQARQDSDIHMLVLSLTGSNPKLTSAPNCQRPSRAHRNSRRICVCPDAAVFRAMMSGEL